MLFINKLHVEFSNITYSTFSPAQEQVDASMLTARVNDMRKNYCCTTPLFLFISSRHGRVSYILKSILQEMTKAEQEKKNRQQYTIHLSYCPSLSLSLNFLSAYTFLIPGSPSKPLKANVPVISVCVSGIVNCQTETVNLTRPLKLFVEIFYSLHLWHMN